MTSKHYCSVLLFALVLIVFACSTTQTDHTTAHPIEGSWAFTSIEWITPDTTYTIQNAQPGLLMINKNRYSIMWTPTVEPRTPFEQLSNPTDEELKSGFRSVVFNAGTYEISDSIVQTQAEIAKVPGFEGGEQFYRYKIEEDKMEFTMFDETYPNGDKPDWYGSLETKFYLKRIPTD